ncbi:hypothetical protein F-VV57_0216 [Faustovirus]|nr:hypothetical protein F-VV57_0216 [Faustovirus]QJX73483.1 hypothetical protein F-VV63_0217 [Faustovirus]
MARISDINKLFGNPLTAHYTANIWRQMHAPRRKSVKFGVFIPMGMCNTQGKK